MIFLSKHISCLEQDGSLVIDLASRGGPKLRFGPIAHGMSWERWEKDRWVPTDYDYGVRVVNRAHESRSDLPVLEYLSDVPASVLTAFDCIGWLQATMLQLWARWPQAQDLIQGNFALFFLVAAEYAKSPERRHLIIDALKCRQRDLLALILRQRVRPAQVRFLRRVVFDRGNRTSLANVRRFVAEADKVMAFRHWRQVPASLVSLLMESPYLAMFEPLRSEVGAASRPWEFKTLREERCHLLNDTVRLIRMIQPEGFGEQILPRYRSWSRVERVHDQMVRVAETLGWESLLDAEIGVEQRLCKPPIPASQGITPIQTVAELVAESELMSHCVVIRARDAIEGLAAIYRFEVAGERGTLEIAVGDDMEPLAIEQFKLACNKEPSTEAWEKAEKWFEDGRRTWARKAALEI